VNQIDVSVHRHPAAGRVTIQTVLLIRVLGATVIACSAGITTLAAQQEERCLRAEQFVVDELGMTARVDPDTLNDWRTGKRLAACRITAAGARRSSLAVTARIFYEKVRAAGWTRTPNPADSPGEASLRFRMDNVDCLFNIYQGILLGTDSEIDVTDAVARQPGEELYHVLVLCVPAMEAKPAP
jgi:hypothetical protein